MPFTLTAWTHVHHLTTTEDQDTTSANVIVKLPGIAPSSSDDTTTTIGQPFQVSNPVLSIDMGPHMWMTEWRHDIRQALSKTFIDDNHPLSLILTKQSGICSQTPMLVHGQTLHTLHKAMMDHLPTIVASYTLLQRRHLQVFDAWMFAIDQAGSDGGILFY